MCETLHSIRSVVPEMSRDQVVLVYTQKCIGNRVISYLKWVFKSHFGSTDLYYFPTLYYRVIKHPFV